LIRYLTHNEIDFQKWDECIKQSFQNNIFAYSWYLNIVAENQWDALVEGDYNSIMPLPWRKKLGFYYIYQPFFAPQLGLYSKIKTKQNSVKEFLSAIPVKFKFVDISLNEVAIVPEMFSATNKLTQVLDLSPDYDQIQNNYSDNLKRNIKKAFKAKLQIKPVTSKEIIELFKKSLGDTLKEFKKQDLIRLFKLMEYCTTNGKGTGLGVFEPEGELQAAGFFIQSDNRIIYLKGAGTESGKKNGAMHYLMDTVIRERTYKNFIFDFGGSNVESLSRFYKSFGAIDCVYLQIKKNTLPKPLKWFKK